MSAESELAPVLHIERELRHLSVEITQPKRVVRIIECALIVAEMAPKPVLMAFCAHSVGTYPAIPA